uniref:MATA-HMG n=2 Tax=Rhizophagus irregularis TaxID=588596 RepID=A0A1B1EWA3_9GLOM|nr:MATA-HMG [Rhizophagus irregularis]
MESQTNEFKEEIQFIQFDNPLQNETFLHYLEQNNVPCDFNRLYNDPSYAQALYDNYYNHLILEYFRPKFPPTINVEEYANENKKNKKIKDMSKMNKGNGFMVYRKNLNKHLEILRERITMQQLSPLAGSLWNSEPVQVKEFYKELSEKIKKLHNNRVENYIKNNHKRSSEDNYDYENMSSKKFKEMTTKNGGNAFIIFRKQLNENLRSLGYNYSMQEHSKIASYLWSRQSKEVQSHSKEFSGQFKKTLNDQLKQMFCKSDNDNNEPIIDNDSLNIKSNNDDNGLNMSYIKLDNDASTNDVHDSCWTGESKPYGSFTNDFNKLGPESIVENSIEENFFLTQ